MNKNKMLNLAKEVGLDEVSLAIFKSKNVSVSLYHHEIDSYENEKANSCIIKGVYHDHFASVSTNKLDEKNLRLSFEEAKLSAAKSEKEEKPIIFSGSPKYKRRNMFNKELDETPLDYKINLIREIENKLEKSDPRIINVAGVAYIESSATSTLINSKGLNLSKGENYFIIQADVIAKGKDEKSRSYFDVAFGNDLKTFNVDGFVSKVKDGVIAKLDAKSIKSKKYPAILNPKVTSTFLKVLVGWLNAEKVQKHTSKLEGKLNEQVISKKVTIIEDPHVKNLFFVPFDDEGVATQKKVLFDKGVVKTYLYNLETAFKDNASSTGNGTGFSSVGIGPFFLTLKPSKKSEEELMKNIKEGVYITEVKGLHSGLDSTSGDFSLEAEGFLIENGKKTTSISGIAIAGNVLQLFKDVMGVASNATLNVAGTSTSSMRIKSLQVSGE